MERKDIIIVSFSKKVAANHFHDESLVLTNLLLSSFFKIKITNQSWITELFSSKEIVNIFRKKSNVFDNVFDSEYIEEDTSIRWRKIFDHILNNHSKRDALVEKIDNKLIKNSEIKFAGFQQYNNSHLYFFNTDQLYTNNQKAQEKLPDFLVQAWCDAYVMDPEEFEFKLVMHDKDVDGGNATPKCYNYCCELISPVSKTPLFLLCRIITFEHLPSNKMFDAFTKKSIEDINIVFNTETFNQKNDLVKCEQYLNKSALYSDSQDIDRNNKNKANDFRIKNLSGGPNALNYVVELLQNAIIESKFSEEVVNEAIIELNDCQKRDLYKYIQAFLTKIQPAVKHKRIVLSADQIQPALSFLSAILELNTNNNDTSTSGNQKP